MNLTIKSYQATISAIDQESKGGAEPQKVPDEKDKKMKQELTKVRAEKATLEKEAARLANENRQLLANSERLSKMLAEQQKHFDEKSQESKEVQVRAFEKEVTRDSTLR